MEELTDVLLKIVIRIVRQAAYAPSVTCESRAELSFENFQDLFALSQGPQQDRDGSDVQCVRCEPKQMRSNSIQLSKNGAQIMRASRNIQSHHLLDGFDPNQTVRNRGDIIEAVPIGRNHRILPVLGNFF